MSIGTGLLPLPEPVPNQGAIRAHVRALKPPSGFLDDQRMPDIRDTITNALLRAQADYRSAIAQQRETPTDLGRRRVIKALRRVDELQRAAAFLSREEACG